MSMYYFCQTNLIFTQKSLSILFFLKYFFKNEQNRKNKFTSWTYLYRNTKNVLQILNYIYFSTTKNA